MPRKPVFNVRLRGADQLSNLDSNYADFRNNDSSNDPRILTVRDLRSALRGLDGDTPFRIHLVDSDRRVAGKWPLEVDEQGAAIRTSDPLRRVLDGGTRRVAWVEPRARRDQSGLAYADDTKGDGERFDRGVLCFREGQRLYVVYSGILCVFGRTTMQAYDATANEPVQRHPLGEPIPHRLDSEYCESTAVRFAVAHVPSILESERKRVLATAVGQFTLGEIGNAAQLILHDMRALSYRGPCDPMASSRDAHCSIVVEGRCVTLRVPTSHDPCAHFRHPLYQIDALSMLQAMIADVQLPRRFPRMTLRCHAAGSARERLQSIAITAPLFVASRVAIAQTLNSWEERTLEAVLDYCFSNVPHMGLSLPRTLNAEEHDLLDRDGGRAVFDEEDVATFKHAVRTLSESMLLRMSTQTLPSSAWLEKMREHLERYVEEADEIPF